MRAKKLGLASSRIADAVFSPYPHEVSSLFDNRNRGRFFTMLREPVSRIISLYHFRQVQGLLPTDATSIEQFVATAEENWMTRMLSNRMTGRIGRPELNVAKEVLRRKFLIGLWEDKNESLRRIELYFGWTFPDQVAENAQNCKNAKLHFDWHNKNPHQDMANEEALVRQIQAMNRYDIELYAYARQLFLEQSGMFWNGSSGGEHVVGQETRGEQATILK